MVGVALDEAVEGAVVEQAALLDDNHALAQLNDIGHVVAGEHDGRARALVVGLDELAHGLLHHDIEADGGLVEK